MLALVDYSFLIPAESTKNIPSEAYATGNDISTILKIYQHPWILTPTTNRFDLFTTLL